MDTNTRDHTASEAVADGPPRSWGDVEGSVLERIEPSFIVVSWLLCVLASIAIAVVGGLIVSMGANQSLFGETNTELGVLTILSAMGTFIGFVLVMTVRLVHVAHDRLLNSLSVAALHVGVALLLFLGNLTLRGIAGVDLGTLFAGPWTDEVGNLFEVLERSAAASIAACLLAAGLVPARGDRPHGTQKEALDPDLQL